MSRLSDSFSTVPPIVNGGDWGCIVRDLGTIIVLVLLAINFHHTKSHTLRRSRFRNSTTLTLTPGDRTTAIKVIVICITNNFFPSMGKSYKVYRRNDNGPKTQSSGTFDTTLTSLLMQPSSVNWHNFDKNCVSIDSTEPQIPTEQSL